MRLKLALLAMTLLAGASASAQTAEGAPEVMDTSRTEAVEMAYSLSRGASQTYSLEASFASEGLEGTAGSRLEMTLSMPLSYEVQSVDSAGVALVATSLRDPAVTLTEDGETADGGTIAQSLRSARLTQAVSSDGTVTERSGGFEVLDNRDVYALGFVSDTLAMRWMQFPQEPVAIGDSWLQVIPMDMHDSESGLQATVSARYTLAGFERGGQVAVVQAEYTTTIEGVSNTRTGRSARIVGRGAGEGTIRFDHGASRINEMVFQNGIVLTATESNGARTVRAFSQEATLRARVVGAVTAP